MSRARLGLILAALLTLLGRPVTARQPATRSDSARPQIRAVLRAYYLSYRNQSWDALSMLDFEHRWRFIYTDMFEPPAAPAKAAR